MKTLSGLFRVTAITLILLFPLQNISWALPNISSEQLAAPTLTTNPNADVPYLDVVLKYMHLATAKGEMISISDVEQFVEALTEAATQRGTEVLRIENRTNAGYVRFWLADGNRFMFYNPVIPGIQEMIDQEQSIHKISDYLYFQLISPSPQDTELDWKTLRLLQADKSQPPAWSKGLRQYYTFLQCAARPGQEPGTKGTFTDLKYIADHAKDLGFNALFLLPLLDTAGVYNTEGDGPYNSLSHYALDPRLIDWEALGIQGSNAKERWDFFSANMPSDFESFQEQDFVHQYAFVKRLKIVKEETQGYGITDFTPLKQNLDKIHDFAQMQDVKLLYQYICMEQYVAIKQLIDLVKYVHSIGLFIGFDQPMFKTIQGVEGSRFNRKIFAQYSDGRIKPAVFAEGAPWEFMWGDADKQEGLARYNWDEMREQDYEPLLGPMRHFIETLGFDFVRGDAFHFAFSATGFYDRGLYERVVELCEKNGALFVPENLGGGWEVDDKCIELGQMPICMIDPSIHKGDSISLYEAWNAKIDYIQKFAHQHRHWQFTHHDSERIMHEFSTSFPLEMDVELRAKIMHAIAALGMPNFSLLYGDEFLTEERINNPEFAHEWNNTSPYMQHESTIETFIRKLNLIRDNCPYLADFGNLQFLNRPYTAYYDDVADKGNITDPFLSFARYDANLEKAMLCIINVTDQAQKGRAFIKLNHLGIDIAKPLHLRDMISGTEYRFIPGQTLFDDGSITCELPAGGICVFEVAAMAGKGFHARLTDSLESFLLSDSTGKPGIEAGRPNFEGQEWGRDTMISLLGFIQNGLVKESRAILLKWAGLEKNGIIPNVYSEAADFVADNTSDASLWLIEALHEYIQKTGDTKILDEQVGWEHKTVRNVLRNIYFRYSSPDKNNSVHGDVDTGFVYVPGQSTWMDTIHTPRRGYPVEIQALWYNALIKLQIYDPEWAKTYENRASAVKSNFIRFFWNDAENTVYDLLGLDNVKAPEFAVPDPAVRCNQIFCVYFGLVDGEHAKKILRSTHGRLLLPGALKSLAEPKFVYKQVRDEQGHVKWKASNPGKFQSAKWPFANYYPEYDMSLDRDERDMAYHNGTGWVWPYAFYKVSAVREKFELLDTALGDMSCAYIRLLQDPFTKGTPLFNGSLPELTDAEVQVRYDHHDTPYHYASPKGCYAQTWSVASALWGYNTLLNGKFTGPIQVVLDEDDMEENNKPLAFLDTIDPEEVKFEPAVKMEFFNNMDNALKSSLRTFFFEDTEKLLSIEAGRTNFTGQEWGRDTMIALLGVISAGMFKEARDILLKWATMEQNGVIPNVKGWAGSAANENTSDASLWYIEALHEYLEASEDEDILTFDVGGGKNILEASRNIIRRYSTETSDDSIHGHESTGFVYSPKQATWMDTKYTPRQGYPVEIQALWYNALLKMSQIDPEENDELGYTIRAEKVKGNFYHYFWNHAENTVYDVLGTDGVQSPAEAVPDPAVRLNQIFAVYFNIIEGEDAKNIVKSTMNRLLLPGSLRSLAKPERVYKQTTLSNGRIGWESHEPVAHEVAAWPCDAVFHPWYESDADVEVRDRAYHNGTGWVWPYPFLWITAVRAGLVTKQEAVKVMSKDFMRLLQDNWTGATSGNLGSLPELTDGEVVLVKNPKNGMEYYYAYPKGCGEQAWSVSSAILGFNKIFAGDKENILKSAEETEIKPPEYLELLSHNKDIDADMSKRIRRLNIGLNQSMQGFLVTNPLNEPAIEAGQPNFPIHEQEWGRDSLIALLGLIATGEFDKTKELILKWGRLESYGKLPNVRGFGGYYNDSDNTSDAPLWLFEVVYRYIEASNDKKILNMEVSPGKTLLQVLQYITERYSRWNDDGVRGHSLTGFVYVPDCSTWMDTPHTARQGYPVEIQALWYNALNIMSKLDNANPRMYSNEAQSLKNNFLKYFWNANENTVYDVLGTDGPKMPEEAVLDNAVRCNQIFAVYFGLVEGEHASKIVKSTLERLRVPGALRSLAESHSGYKGQFNNNLEEYHNGTGWVWVYPFLWLSAARLGLSKKDALNEMSIDLSRLFDDPYTEHSLPELTDGNVVQIDGDNPYLYSHPKGTKRQAWSVASALWGFQQLISDGYKSLVKTDTALDATDTTGKFVLETRQIKTTNVALAESLLSFLFKDKQSQTSVMAGRPHFDHQEWGRDTMISLLGIISAGWLDEARDLIVKWAKWERNGIIPNVKGWAGSAENDNTSDAALWFVEIVYHYIEALNGDDSILNLEISKDNQIRHVLRNIIKRYWDETDKDSVHGHEKTGLVYVQAESTWMDTQNTRRQGYPVEIQALWYNALMKMSIIDKSSGMEYAAKANTVKQSFNDYFWNEHEETLYDVLGTDGVKSPAEAIPDPAIRLNQIFAVYFGLLDKEKAKKVITCTMGRLRLPGALRSLAEPKKVYKQIELPSGQAGWEVRDPIDGESPTWPFATFYPFYETHKSRDERNQQYHNGTGWVWPYPFLWVCSVREGLVSQNEAMKEMQNDFSRLLKDPWTGPGSLPELTDGSVKELQDDEGKYLYAYPKGCGEQAWSVAIALWAFERIGEPRAFQFIYDIVYEKLKSPESKKPIVTSTVKAAYQIISNAKNMIPRMINALMIWTGRAPKLAETDELRQKRVLAIDLGQDTTDDVIQSIIKNILKPLRNVHTNNENLEVILKNLHIIVDSKDSLCERLKNMATRPDQEEDRLKYQNVIIVTPDKNREAFETLTGGEALLTAFDDSELNMSGTRGIDYYPIIEVAFFAILRSLGRFDERTSPEDRGYFKESLWKWYTRIPNIDLGGVDKATLMRMCFNPQGKPRRTVILKLIPTADKYDYHDLEEVQKQLGEILSKA